MNIVRVSITRVNRRGRVQAISVDEHVSAMSFERQWSPVADVIIHLGAWPYELDEMVHRETLARYPGCLIVAWGHADGTCGIATRDGQLAHFVRPEPWMAASAAHAWTVGGGRLGDLDAASITVREACSRRVSPGAVEPVLLEVRQVR
ncbi:hypothetical protein AB0B89_32715 [Sphaerisporangium sp. NPDC049002]|uniref:hypothetical protein n=1 Tax=unclassified Sphaerisporangium TaxID=2630420 RepID=UPI003411DDC3